MMIKEDVDDAISSDGGVDDKKRGKTKRQVWSGGSVKREAWRRRGRNG